MSNGNHRCFIRDLLTCIIHVKDTFWRQLDIFQNRFLAFCQLLPWDDIGMVLHVRDHDLITFIDKLIPKTAGYPIQACRRTTSEQHFVGFFGLNKMANFFPRGFIRMGRPFRQCMNATVNVGIVLMIIGSDRLQNGFRLLGGGSIIKID